MPLLSPSPTLCPSVSHAMFYCLVESVGYHKGSESFRITRNNIIVDWKNVGPKKRFLDQMPLEVIYFCCLKIFRKSSMPILCNIVNLVGLSKNLNN